MSGTKRVLERVQEREDRQWEVVARKNGFYCSTCGTMLTREEVDAFGNVCSEHQDVPDNW
jgi:hypothetical protein